MATSSVRRAMYLLRVFQTSSYRSVISVIKPICFKRINARLISGTAITLAAEGDTKSTATDKDSPGESDDSQLSSMCDPYVEEPDPCFLCIANIPVSFKNVQLLSQFVSPNTGKIYDRKITKLCNFQQKRIEREIQISRVFGLMPYMYRETIFLKDPNVYNISYTGNPNIGSSVSLPLSTEDYEKQPEVMAAKKTEGVMTPKKRKQPLWKSGKLIATSKKKK